MFLRTLVASAAISLMIGCGTEDDTTPTTGAADAEQVQTDAAPAVNSSDASVSPEPASDASTPGADGCSEDEPSSDATVESGC